MNSYGITYYSDPASDADLEHIARNYGFGITSPLPLSYCNRMAEIKAMREAMGGEFRWYGYETTDVRRGSWVADLIDSMDDPEAAYYHYAEPTTINWGGDVGTHHFAEGDRVCVYGPDRWLRRFAPDARPMHAITLDAAWEIRADYIHGMFLDNAAQSLWPNNMGQVISGGNIREVNGSAGSRKFAAVWNAGLNQFIIGESAKRPMVVNVVNSWPNVERWAPGTIQYQEGISPKRAYNKPGWAKQQFEAISRAHGVGVPTWLNCGGSDALNNFAFFGAVRQDSTLFGTQDRYQLTDGWREAAWCDLMGRGIEWNQRWAWSRNDDVFVRGYGEVMNVPTIECSVYTGPPHADYQQGEARIVLAEQTTPQPEPEPEPEPTLTRADVLREIAWDALSASNFLKNIGTAIDELADMEEADDE